MKLKNLIKSYGFWTALAGAVVVLINAIGKACGFFVEEDVISNIIMGVAGVLVVFGVVTIPSSAKTEEEQTKEISQEEIVEENKEEKE